ncbi:hypothetical protein RGQ15_06745 [Paracoccus sp. MBLB3053]|uniref:SGNH/GDSL hydrolase family protein n=1 Tax=Paracoccus aurantius TaxID=3073814 RepID=A0ABU2HQF9_9RHOB|nr:hypothetical protein [Paracoccus sp. MBLB3053]MDS9467271.1 hypothetical protein [Paracoccus sp. MBLB3053]
MHNLAVISVALIAIAALFLAFRWRGGWMPRGALVGVAVAVIAAGHAQLRSKTPDLPAHDDGADVRALYDQPRKLPQSPVRVYHLGHSLVGRDMPAMLAQLAGHEYAIQLGWGAALSEHLAGPEAVGGFEEENASPHHRDPHEALESGEYGAFVMTEMVSLRDAILWKDSIAAAGQWAAEAVMATPDIEVFLYESWHGLDESPDWLTRFPDDLDQLWSQLLWSATRAAGRPVWLIPVGQVLAKLVGEAEAGEGIAELRRRQDLFARMPDGSQDNIHPNDLGAYLVALTHYAVIYGKNPIGLPHELRRADGSMANAPSPELAQRMQEIVWEVVTSQPLTGL